MFPYILQGSNLTVVVDNKTHTISKSHMSFQKVVDAIKAQDWDTVRESIEPKKVVLNYGRGNVTINNDTLHWKGVPMHNALATRMLAMLQEGFSIDPMVSFMENLMQNPSKRAVDELYGFLEKNNLPITPDGYFLAYKRVRADYKDVHSGTMDNSVGKIVEMERNQVDDDKNRTCSAGLHFCAHSYLAHFSGARTVIVKINPRDVVSIPSDYNDAKGRACRYEVISEVDNQCEDSKEFTKPVQQTANNTVGNKTSTKLGTSEFYRGYSDGFYDRAYQSGNVGKWAKDYDEGYDKGADDRDNENPERYRYAGSAVVRASAKPLNPDVSWPFPIPKN